MQLIMGSFGKFLVYLIKTSFGGAVSLFFSGLLAGLGISSLFKGPKPEVEDQIQRRKWRLIIVFGLSGVLLAVAMAVGGTQLAAWYWPLFLIGFMIGLFLRLFPLVTSGVTFVLAVLLIVLLFSLVLTFHAFTGKTAILEVDITKVGQEDGTRVSTLVVTDLIEEEKRTFEVQGTKWGVSANLAVMDNWVMLLGGRTYYRLNSIVGVSEATIKRQSFHCGTQPTWDELWIKLEAKEGKIPGVRAVYEEMILKPPVPGRVYRIYLDNDGGMVPELIRERKQ
jgi:hypothetical protein